VRGGRGKDEEGGVGGGGQARHCEEETEAGVLGGLMWSGMTVGRSAEQGGVCGGRERLGGRNARTRGRAVSGLNLEELKTKTGAVLRGT